MAYAAASGEPMSVNPLQLIFSKRPLSPILKVLGEEWEVCGRGSRG